MATSTEFRLRLTTDDHGGVRVHAACTGPRGDRLSDERFVSGPERTQCRVPDLPLHAGIRHVLDTLGTAEPWPDSALRALRAACDGHPAPPHHTAAAVLR
ncbi:MAG TPA: hypothetical protein VGE72_30190, partial [Azospirillum sp.]